MKNAVRQRRTALLELFRRERFVCAVLHVTCAVYRLTDEVVRVMGKKAGQNDIGHRSITCINPALGRINGEWPARCVVERAVGWLIGAPMDSGCRVGRYDC